MAILTRFNYLLIIFGIAFCASGCASKKSHMEFEKVEAWPTLSVQKDLGQATGIAVDSHNHVFVFHRAGREWSEPFPVEPIAKDTVVMLEGETGRELASWGSHQMIMPHGLSVDASDHVWVTDVGGQQVHKFSHEGKLLLSLGSPHEPGNDASHFALPADVAVDPLGRILIADGYTNTRIAYFAPDGKYEGQWGTPGSGPAQFSLPHGISLGPDGRIFVADRANRRLQIFDTDYKYLDAWGGKHIGRPYGVDIDADGTIYLIDGGDQPDKTRAIIRILTPKGQEITAIDTSMSADAEGGVLGHDIAISSDGMIYVVDAWANRIIKYKPTN